MDYIARYVKDFKRFWKQIPKGQVFVKQGEGEETGRVLYAFRKIVEGYWVYLQLIRGPGERLIQLVIVLNPRERALVDQLLFSREFDADVHWFGFGGDFGSVWDLKREIIACPSEGDSLCGRFLIKFMRKIQNDPGIFLRRADVLREKEPSRSIYAFSGGAPGLGKRA